MIPQTSISLDSTYLQPYLKKLGKSVKNKNEKRRWGSRSCRSHVYSYITVRTNAHAHNKRNYAHTFILITIQTESSCVLVVVVVEEVGRDVPSSLESLHQPPLRAAYPVMRTPQEDSLPH